MNVSYQKQLPLSSCKIAEHPSGFPVVISPKILISEKEYLELKWEAGYYQGLHAKALLREEILKKTIKEQDGQLNDLKNRLFGKKSEKKYTPKNEGGKKPASANRSRGQQPGSTGHGRTTRPHLPSIDEKVDFAETPKCSKCGTSYIADGSRNSEIIEVEVKAHKRVLNLRCMRKDCSCKGVPNTVTAPLPPKLIPKSPYGLSIWEAVLLSKFHYCQPTNRLLNQYAELGLPISAGSITGGLKILQKLFQPIYEAFYRQQMTEERFHSDESGWKVFESVDGKIGNRWWLWVSRSASVVYFQIAPGRGADIPVDHFKNIQLNRNKKIIVVCDRYSSYKSLSKQLSFILLAFCWAHVRRDFLDAARKYPDLEEWAFCWVEKIGELYHINNRRCKEFDKKLPLQWQSASFKKQHEKLVGKMNAMAEERDAFVEAYKPDNHCASLISEVKYKILISLQNHWKGLSIFAEHPEVPMDNNKAERSIRNPVTGRKNFYGSGSLWSSQLAAIMFSIFQTMTIGGLNCNHWLRLYLTACAENHGKVPEDLSPFLPWQMDGDRRRQLSIPFNTS